MNATGMNKPSETNWDRVDALDDCTIDTSDVSPLPESFFTRTRLRVPPSPVALTLNVDSDVIRWFKAQGDTASLPQVQRNLHALDFAAGTAPPSASASV